MCFGRRSVLELREGEWWTVDARELEAHAACPVFRVTTEEDGVSSMVKVSLALSKSR